MAWITCGTETFSRQSGVPELQRAGVSDTEMRNENPTGKREFAEAEAVEGLLAGTSGREG